MNAIRFTCERVAYFSVHHWHHQVLYAIGWLDIKEMGRQQIRGFFTEFYLSFFAGGTAVVSAAAVNTMMTGVRKSRSGSTERETIMHPTPDSPSSSTYTSNAMYITFSLRDKKEIGGRKNMSIKTRHGILTYQKQAVHSLHIFYFLSYWSRRIEKAFCGGTLCVAVLSKGKLVNYYFFNSTGFISINDDFSFPARCARL